LLGVDLESWSRSTAEAAASLEHSIELDLARRRHERDDVAGLTAALTKLRASRTYADSWAIDNPLVSVRIATYRRPQPLVEVAIASVLRQSYANLELIVVHDGPDPETRAAVEAIDDARIRYDELPERGLYPDNRDLRWMVAGSPAMNRGADLARGTWLAPLDDDDEFTTDHLEKLVALARAERAELAYGAVTHRNTAIGVDSHLWSSPPSIGAYSFNGAIYLRSLHPWFRWDEGSWVVDEPADWNLARRMIAAGVRMATTEDSVAVLNVVPLDARTGP
jgi:glycosyltransferase involved in cell wall biosynthesis